MRWRFLLSIVTALLVSVGVISVAQAAPLQSFAVRLTRQAPATSTDAEIAFTSPTGVNGPSDSITITFPVDFDLSTIVAGDMSLSYGPTTGYEYATSVGVSAGVDTWGPQRIGRSIFLIPPTNSVPGSIPAGSRMVLRIGTWVLGATHQILTPTVSGIYAVRVFGDFGDSGISYIKIRDNDGLDVTVTVEAAAPEGGGGSPPVTVGGGGSSSFPPTYDGTPPVINGLEVVEISATTARVRWTTDEAADAFLEYGYAGIDYSLGTRTRVGRLTGHEFLLEGLTPERAYQVHVRARDALGNTRWSPMVVFSTTAAPTRLTISGVEVTYVDDHQAIIHWTTSIAALGEVHLTTALGERVISETTAVTSHFVTLIGLNASTFYPFRVTASAPPAEVATVDGPGFSTTSDVTPPSNALNFRGVYVTPPPVVELSWMNPTDPDFGKVVITRLRDSALGGDVFVCGTSETRCSDVPPAGRTTIVYRAVAQDLVGNPSSGAIATVSIPTTDRPTTEPGTSEEPTPITEPVPGTEGTTPPIRHPAAGSDDGMILPPILHPDPAGGALGSAGASGGSVGGSTEGGTTTSSDRIPDETSVVTSTVPDAITSGEIALTLVPEFFLSDTVIATPDHSGIRSALFTQATHVRLPVTGLDTSLSQAQIQTSGGSVYQFAYREALGAFVSDLSFDEAQGQNQFVQIQAVAADGRRWEGRFPFHVWPAARVLDVSDSARSAPIAGATIELSAIPSGASVLHAFADASGRYAEIVPSGRYHLRVTKDGFRTYDQDIQVESGVLVRDVQLRRNLRPLSEVLRSDASLGENISALGSEAVLATQIGLEIAHREEVQAATRNVVAPVVVVATVGATATAVGGFSLLNYLHFLLTQPLLLIRRRKRKSWGVVYNALTKQPIELAIVRLMKAGTTFALQTRITDAQGRFSFFVPVGTYTIQVQKPGFTYPTTYLKQERMDVDFVDLYHGEEVKVTQPVTISPNIPIDPLVKEETPKSILRKRYLRKAQSLLGVGGILVSLGAIVVSPTLPMIGFAVFQVATYALFRRLAIPRAPKRWGIVYDTDGKRPLAKAVVRIFDKKFNKLLETQITTKDGTYGFFVAKGQYYLTAEKPGYERYLSTDLDLTKAKDTYIDHRFSLRRAGTTLQ